MYPFISLVKNQKEGADKDISFRMAIVERHSSTIHFITRSGVSSLSSYLREILSKKFNSLPHAALIIASPQIRRQKLFVPRHGRAPFPVP